MAVQDAWIMGEEFFRSQQKQLAASGSDDEEDDDDEDNGMDTTAEKGYRVDVARGGRITGPIPRKGRRDAWDARVGAEGVASAAVCTGTRVSGELGGVSVVGARMHE